MTTRYNELLDEIDQQKQDLQSEINRKYKGVRKTLSKIYYPGAYGLGYGGIIRELAREHDDVYFDLMFHIKIDGIPQYEELKEIVKLLNRVNHKEEDDFITLPDSISMAGLVHLGDIHDQFAPRVREAADHFFKTKDQTFLDQVIIEALLYYMKLDREPLTKSANKQ
jgi:hypothetical protein